MQLSQHLKLVIVHLASSKSNDGDADTDIGPSCDYHWFYTHNFPSNLSTLNNWAFLGMPKRGPLELDRTESGSHPEISHT